MLPRAQPLRLMAPSSWAGQWGMATSAFWLLTSQACRLSSELVDPYVISLMLACRTIRVNEASPPGERGEGKSP